MMGKLNKESHLTDFFLDKILPVQTFTSMMHIVRTIAQTPEQLAKIEQMNAEFFDGF
jgi:hypothetical protein